MKNLRVILAIVFVCAFMPAFAKKKIPVIRADSEYVSIRRDGEIIFPNVKLDLDGLTFNCEGNNFTVYTDRDSMSFKMKEGKRFDFIVLVNEKDSMPVCVNWGKDIYPSILKKGSKYNYKDKRPVPAFEYQSADAPELIGRRKELNLDSIAGKGNDVSKIINLMYWVHASAKHDGSETPPLSRNAVDLIKFARKENVGLNCRMMAIILNECYLAMGFKSRIVTCMPQEDDFDDCHVINAVYCESLGKWVWMDPSFCAYVMDENGELLGIDEVRERLIKGKTLIVNPDANWNRSESCTKKFYLDYYMMKNLYVLQCPLYSKYDYETRANRYDIVFVELYPVDGSEKVYTETQYTSDGIPYIYYRINNPDVFWAKPE